MSWKNFWVRDLWFIWCNYLCFIQGPCTDQLTFVLCLSSELFDLVSSIIVCFKYIECLGCSESFYVIALNFCFFCIILFAYSAASCFGSTLQWIPKWSGTFPADKWTSSPLQCQLSTRIPSVKWWFWTCKSFWCSRFAMLLSKIQIFKIPIALEYSLTIW